jgi:hypothetical protein
MKAFFLTLVYGTGYFLVGHGGGYRVHEIYCNARGLEIGQYTQWRRGDGFVATCNGRRPVAESDEKAAQLYLEACPGANDR